MSGYVGKDWYARMGRFPGGTSAEFDEWLERNHPFGSKNPERLRDHLFVKEGDAPESQALDWQTLTDSKEEK